MAQAQNEDPEPSLLVFRSFLRIDPKTASFGVAALTCTVRALMDGGAQLVETAAPFHRTR